MISASFTPENARTPAQRAVLTLSETLGAELEAAGQYAFGVPTHILTVSSAFRLWIEQIARAGRTFACVDGGRDRRTHGNARTHRVDPGVR